VEDDDTRANFTSWGAPTEGALLKRQAALGRVSTSGFLWDVARANRLRRQDPAGDPSARAQSARRAGHPRPRRILGSSLPGDPSGALPKVPAPSLARRSTAERAAGTSGPTNVKSTTLASPRFSCASPGGACPPPGTRRLPVDIRAFCRNRSTKAARAR